MKTVCLDYGKKSVFYAYLSAFLSAFLCVGGSSYAHNPSDDLEREGYQRVVLSSDQYVEVAKENGLSLIPTKHKPQSAAPRLLMLGGEASASSSSLVEVHANQDANLDVTAELLNADDAGSTVLLAEEELKKRDQLTALNKKRS